MKDKLLRYQKLSSLIEKVKGSLTQLKSTDQTKVECEIKLASRVVTVFMEKQELVNNQYYG